MKYKPLLVAHRGYSGRYPENTRLAFARAKKLGVDGFELDIQLSRDKKVIVFHDETLERTTNGAGLVGDRTLAELEKLDAGAGEKIPTLAEILKQFKDGPQLYIELKYHRDFEYKPLVNAFLKERNRQKMKYPPVICSFNWPALEYLRKRDKNIGIEVLHISKPFTSVLKFAGKIKAWGLFTNIKEISPKKVTLAHKRDLNVFAWTVNDRQNAARCRRAMVDGVIGNYPDKLR